MTKNNLISDEELTERLANRPAPSVTTEYIDSRIKEVEYATVFGKVTQCNITLDNGFSVRGESACVNPENYDEKIGRRFAYGKAFDKLWPLFGFLLAEETNKPRCSGSTQAA